MFTRQIISSSRGKKLGSDGRALYYGGKGLNQSIAASKAGVPVFHAGKVGAGSEGLLEECAKYGVDTKYIRKTDEPAGHTFIQVDKNGQNSIILFRRKQSGHRLRTD